MIDNAWSMHMAKAEEAMTIGNFKLAELEYMKASAMGCVDARISLAVLYATETDLLGDGVTAKKILENVIENKSASISQIALACNNLSTLYATGASGLNPDKNQSMKYELKARSLGFPR